MTAQEFAALPLGDIILHAAFVSLTLDASRPGPLMWEVSMMATLMSNGAYDFMGTMTPYLAFRFYRLFSPDDLT